MNWSSGDWGWAIFLGGLMQLVGVALIVFDIRVAKEAADKLRNARYGNLIMLGTGSVETASGTGTVTGGAPPDLEARVQNLEGRVAAHDALLSAVPGQIRGESERAAAAAAGVVAAEAKARENDIADATLSAAVGGLRRRGWSVALILVGIALSTLGGVAAAESLHQPVAVVHLHQPNGAHHNGHHHHRHHGHRRSGSLTPSAVVSPSGQG